MNISKLNISNFGKFSDFEASFAPGINVIKGRNEAGKSTMVEAILNALFTDASSKKRSIKDRFKWGTEGARIEVNLSSSEGDFNLNKDFLSGVQIAEENRSHNKWETKEHWGNFLESKLGISNEDLFCATACIRQNEIALISGSSDALRDKLESIITGGQEEVIAGKVIENLNKRINEIKKSGAKEPGILKRLESEAEDLSYEVEKMSREMEAMEARRREMAEVTSKLDFTSQELFKKQEMLEKWQSAVKAAEEKRELERRYDDLKGKLDELNASQQKVIECRQQISGKPEIRKQDMNLVDEMESRIRYLESKLHNLESDEKVPKADLEKIGSLAFLSVLNVVNSLAFIGCLAAGFFLNPIIALGSAPFLVTQIFLFAKLWKQYSRRTALENQFRFIGERISEVRQEIEGGLDTVSQIVAKYEFHSSIQMRESHSFIEDIHRKINDETARYESILAGKNQKDLQQLLNQVTRDLAVITDRLEFIGIFAVNIDDLQKLKTEVEGLSRERVRLEGKKNFLIEQLELTEGGGEQLSSFQERLEHNRMMYERYNRRLNVYKMTSTLIDEARTEILKSTAVFLENKVGEYLSGITSGKYSKIRFDKSNLEFTVFSSEKQDWVSPDQVLSRGTVDQIYLCARLALLNFITATQKPFIILDDPFVHFDADRTQKAISLLKQMSTDYQVLLFTTSDNYDSCANNLINLQ
ncbi:MAG: hypothetical protein CO189_05090 [candidate division Zixibacteria bacterium CG_4_9_14_3_um_filter_46_8]|nr:MAG: hypothetical protein CO189_05090 [candidate division Zixibacteria bacterium CG_4_9_14_3_um_filter_46_8]